MANFVSNALSIAGQQDKTSLYQGSFNAPTFASPQASGHDLASALGLASGAVSQAMQAKEARDTKISIDMAEKVVNAQTDEDMHRKTTIEMIGNYTQDAELQDNPYAKVLIEKAKGSYLASQAHDEYLAWRSQQQPVNSGEEEIARMNEFMNTKHLIAQGTMIDKEAFDKGFNEKSIPMQLQVASMQRTEQAVEMRAQQKASMIADLSQLVEHSDQYGEEDYLKKVQDIVDNVKVGWMKPSDRMEVMKNFLAGISNHTGDFTRIQAIGDKIGIGVNSKGEIIGVKDVIDIGVLKQNAEITTRNLFGLNVQKALTEMEKLNVQGQNEYFAKLSPEMQGVLVHDREKLIEHAKKVEETKRINEAKARAKQMAKQQVQGNILRHAEAFQAGTTNLPDGSKVASSVGSLPKIEYDDIDPTTGRTFKATASYDSQELSATYDFMKSRILNDPNKDDATKTREVMRLMSNPIFVDAKNATVNAVSQSIDSLAYAPTDSAGNVTITPQLQDAMAMYTDNPDAFLKIYGKPAHDKIAQIVENSKAFGDANAGVTAYIRGAGASEEQRNANKAIVHKNLSSISLDGFQDVYGNNCSASASLNNSAMAQLEHLIPQFMNGSDSLETATEKGLNVLKNSYSVYRETLIPKTFFNDVPSENRNQLGQQALDEEVDAFVALSGVGTRDAVTVTYNQTYNTIHFSGGNKLTVRDANQLTRLATEIGKRNPDGSEGKTSLQYSDIIRENKERQEFKQNMADIDNLRYEGISGY